MKLIHLSDLHLGKRLREYSMLDDQAYILNSILGVIDDEKPDGVIIAGDIFDKSVPSAEAVRLFDDFLVRLSRRGLGVYIISGNHDSAERIAYLGRLVETSGVHLSPVYNGEIAPVCFDDEYGRVSIWLLPFIKPQLVKHYFPDEDVESYTDGIRTAIAHMDVDYTQRNVLVTHQFITDSVTCESEELSVGGTDNVDASAVADFDYVALGHLHTAQCCTDEHIRYCGTPLKYSFSEVSGDKSVTVVELREKGSVSIRTVPLVPLHDMAELRGSFEELIKPDFYTGTSFCDDYVRVTLTDEEVVPDAFARLRTVYRRLTVIRYDNARTRASGRVTASPDSRCRSELELFAELYELQNNAPMSPVQLEYMKRITEELKEGRA